MVRKIKKSKLSHSKAEKQAQKELSKKLNMFDRLPDECSACLEPFDKKDREMVTTWNVVVKSQQNLVRLYCPSCWKKAIDVVEEYEKVKGKL